MKESRKFDLDDVAIVPSVISDIESRKECETKNSKGTLPLMAAPMDTVVCTENYERYILEGIIPCIPRGQRVPTHKQTSTYNHLSFQAFGIQEIEDQLNSEEKGPDDFYMYNKVLIDIANGHMAKLVEIVKRIKKTYPYVELMVGNVGNPLTYKNLALAGADYVRLSIGTGAGCTTAANVAINYPLGSLITECKAIKEKDGLEAAIVADGGMRDYSDIIKALALGADYVMLGSVFNKSMESAGFNYWKTKINFL